MNLSKVMIRHLPKHDPVKDRMSAGLFITILLMMARIPMAVPMMLDVERTMSSVSQHDSMEW